MTPEAQAARDRLVAFADPGFRFPAFEFDPELGCATPDEVRRLVDRIVHDVHATLAPDLRIVLALLDGL